MTRVRTVVLLLVAAGMLLAIPAAASAESPTSAMIHRLNKVRHKHGLGSVHRSKSLQKSARRWAVYMMRAHYFGHGSYIHASHRYRMLGEVIEMHWGRSPAVSQTLSSWLHSPPHRRILLSRSFRVAGAGYVRGTYRGHRATMWVMHFGRP